MATNVYECLIILDPNRYARDPQGVSATIPEMVKKSAGEILANRLWNEQKLAYTINGHRKGTYWLTYFRMDSTKLAGFNRACQLNDFVMRHMVTKIDARLVDILVAHARGEGADEPAGGASPELAAKAGSADKKATEEVAATKDE
ncbi:MAG TPA: 30S ribosomal protein S6 [Pirellulaceae bacterium]|nr:30S ribosomal protein S6 [Pirellulaceae bacterium]